VTEAVIVHEKKGIPALLEHEASRARIAPFLPEGVNYERVVAATILATKRQPEILKCKPETIVLAVAKIAQWGLEVGETAHLVPFGDVCTPVADYKGLVRLLYASGAIRRLTAECVYANETFEYEQGSAPRIRHVPITRGDRGEMIGAYVFIDLPYQRWVTLFMRLDEIEAIRLKKSRSWKGGDCPPWYAKKTVIKQAVKLLPTDKRTEKALREVEQLADLEEAELVPEKEVLTPIAGDEVVDQGEGAE
jgi:recombination protein RecT